MRSAGTSTPERMRDGAASAPTERRRTPGLATPERLRSGSSTLPAERGRAAGQGLDESFSDPFLRAHPPAQGCSIFTIQGVAGIGTAGCAVAGLDLGYRP